MNASDATALPDLENQLKFARKAEALGIDSLLVDFGYNKPDSIILSTALGLQTKRIKFIIASRSGLMSPATFVQQLNTLSALIDGRFSLNMVAGHSPVEQRYYGDFLSHDERYARTGEYLDICHRFWRRENYPVNFSGEYYQIENGEIKTPFVSPERSAPEIFIAGSSAPAVELAHAAGDIWVTLAQPVDLLAQAAANMVAGNKEVAIRLSVICRETREEAIAAAEELIQKQTDEAIAEKGFVTKSDSVGIKRALDEADGVASHWLTSCLWNGAVKSFGAPSIALVGSPKDIADAIIEYYQIGVTQLILSGWPQFEEMCLFGQSVLPLLRQKVKTMSSNATNQQM